MGYGITLVVLLTIYILGIIFLKRIKASELINTLVPLIIFSLYLWMVVTIYLDVGLYDWNFTNVLPTANVSPFMFFSCLFLLILPKKIRKYEYTLISLLSLGLVCATIINLISNIVIDYKFHMTFAVDSFNHFLLSWYGIYLYKTEQIFKEKRNLIISGSLIVLVAFLMLIINAIFRTEFFGLSLYGNHNIYLIVVGDNSYVSALIYFTGLIGVLILGYLFNYIFIPKIINNKGE